jgi:hypothetical protein
MPLPQVAVVTAPQTAVVIPIEYRISNLEKEMPPPLATASPSKSSAMDFANTVKPDSTQGHYTKLKRKFETRELPPSVQDLETYWRSLLSMYDYHRHMTLTTQDHGMMKSLRKEIEGAGVKIHTYIEYCIANWKRLQSRILYENGKTKMGETPQFKMVFFNRHDILDIMRLNGGAKKAEKATRTYTKAEDLPAMPAARKAQLTTMIEKLGSVTI